MTAAPAEQSAFGTLIAACDVEAALLAQTRTWMRTYLAEIDRQHGQPVGTLPVPRAYVISGAHEKMPEDQTPAVMIVSPGMTDPPVADGQGRYTARWGVDVAVLTSARGNEHALRLARLEVLALRALLIQQQTLPDERLSVRRIEFIGEHYNELDSIDDRTICLASVSLAVEIGDVTTRHAGPLAPLLPPEPDPGPDSPAWPIAETADVNVTKQPV